MDGKHSKNENAIVKRKKREKNVIKASENLLKNLLIKQNKQKKNENMLYR